MTPRFFQLWSGTLLQIHSALHESKKVVDDCPYKHKPFSSCIHRLSPLHPDSACLRAGAFSLFSPQFINQSVYMHCVAKGGAAGGGGALLHSLRALHFAFSQKDIFNS